MHDQEKLARDINLKFSERWDEPIFANIVASEQRHMDELAVMIVFYDLPALIETDEIGVFGDDRHTEAFSELTSRGEQSLLEAFRAAAYLEEWDIKELNADIESTAEADLARYLATHQRTNRSIDQYTDSFSANAGAATLVLDGEAATSVEIALNGERSVVQNDVKEATRIELPVE